MAKVAPLGAVIATTGSLKAGPPPAPTDGVTVTVPVEPASAFVGDETPTASTGAAVVVVVAVLVTGVAPSGVSVTVTEVVWAPGVDENVTEVLIVPRAVPAAIGVTAVEVQVATVLAALSAQL